MTSNRETSRKRSVPREEDDSSTSSNEPCSSYTIRLNSCDNDNYRRFLDMYDSYQEISETEELEDGEYISPNNSPAQKCMRMNKSGVNRKRIMSKAFILDEAEVSEDDDDGEAENFISEEEEYSSDSREQSLTAQKIEDHMRIQTSKNSQREGIIDYLEYKYGSNLNTSDVEESDDEINDEFDKQTLLPGANDPKLWFVRCSAGKEKDSAFLLMQKFIRYQDTEQSLKIQSVLVRDKLKGYIYIEAFKQSHVKAAIEDISFLKLGRRQQKLVPLMEMTDTLRVKNWSRNVRKGQWVRIKSGVYKGDIALVKSVDLLENEMELMIVPRMNFTRCQAKAFNTMEVQANNEVIIPRKRRPEAKLFNPSEMKAQGNNVILQDNMYIFKGNKYSKTGFLYKTYSINAVIFSGVKPTLEECQIFDLDKKSIHSVKRVKITLPQSFCYGDTVEVCDGELKFLLGKVTHIEGEKVTIEPKHDILKAPLEFHVNELKKYFDIGDYIKVTEGNHKGEFGFVVRVNEDKIILFSDSTHKEIEVLPKHVQKSLEKMPAPDISTEQAFQWGDIVHIDPQIVGVVVSSTRNIVRILSMYDKIIEAKPQSLHKRLSTGRIFASDYSKNKINPQDFVKVIDGKYEGKDGIIKYLHYRYAFLYSRTFYNNGGLFVCKTNHLLLAGVKCVALNDIPQSLQEVSSPQILIDDGKAKGLAKGSVRLAAVGKPAHLFQSGDRQIIGKTVIITKGSFKGCVGIVRDITCQNAEVEIHSSCKNILVDRADMICLGVHTKRGLLTPMSSEDKTPQYKGESSTPSYSTCASPFTLCTPVETPRADFPTPSYHGSYNASLTSTSDNE